MDKKNEIILNLLGFIPLLHFEANDRFMNKFKISYICRKKPDKWIHLDGFEEGRQYWGRAFNGLFEVSPLWGSDKPTKIINKRIFESFFELVN